MPSISRRFLSCSGLLILAAAAAATPVPQPVSPGGLQGVRRIDQRCPTFSWGAGGEASAYELVVYRLPEDPGALPGEGSDVGAAPRLHTSIPGAATSWTPSVDQCLEPGARYAWSVRAQGEAGSSAWSEPRLFEVSVGLSDTELQQALGLLLERHLAKGGSLADLGRRPETAGDEPAVDGSAPARAGKRQRTVDSKSPVLDERSQRVGVTGPTAIRGEQADPSGASFGVVGTSASPDGAGVGAANTAGGADLVLDGVADGETDTVLTQAGIDRPSAGAESFEIANTGGGTVTLLVGGVEAVTTATDQDTVGALSCASGQLAKWNGSVWQCEVDLDTNTLYGNGFGLDLAGTTFSADTAEVQQRVTGNCPAGESIRAVQQDGTVACEVDDDTTNTAGPGLVLENGVIRIDPAAFSTRVSTLDTAGIVAEYTSMALGADGLGLISYYDQTSGDLKVAHCTDTACTSATITTLDSSGSVGRYTSIAIGTDGLGLISYYDGSSADLKVAHCNDTACSSATLTTLDSVGFVGRDTSIVIGTDGLGLISYWDATNSGLKVAHCNDIACTSATNATLDSVDFVGEFTSIALGTDSLGLISYWDATNSDLKVAHCNDTACTSATTASLDSSGSVGRYTSIAIGADGLGLISYLDETNLDLKVAHCNDTACSSATLTTLDSAGFVGRDTSITIGADGLGLISYLDYTNRDLKVAHCNDTACTSANSATLDSAGLVGHDTSIAIGADGLGLISYRDGTNGHLRVAHLGIAVP